MYALKEKINRHLSNLPGWRTRRQILVLESDDWGSIRMPSLAAFERLRAQGLSLDRGDALRYNSNDTLAGSDDFDALFSVLERHRDRHHRPAVVTALSLVANPDFDRIRDSGFESYYYEPFTHTLERYYPGAQVFRYWQEGIRQGLFIPQFHGREHLNIAAWMKALREKDPQTHAAFREGCWGFSNHHPYRVRYQAAFDVTDPAEIDTHHQIIREGLDLFEQLHGYRASFFVPPNGPFNNALEPTAAAYGIRFMSSSKVQHEALGLGKTRRCLHFLGQRNAHGQRYITRNCFFEPSQAGRNWVESCLQEIAIAFRWHKPAVVSTHRVNFIGALQESNRAHGLNQLDQLLREVTRRWPEVEFMSSDQLGRLMAGEPEPHRNY